MTREVKLSRLDDLLSELDYPVTKGGAAEAFSDVTLLFADGEERFADVVERSSVGTFESASELHGEIYNNLPTEAVGEPGQSEGEG
ncbi:MAG: hypothetical protein ABEJ04_06100 [Halobacteriaceae archaeon]